MRIEVPKNDGFHYFTFEGPDHKAVVERMVRVQRNGFHLDVSEGPGGIPIIRTRPCFEYWFVRDPVLADTSASPKTPTGELQEILESMGFQDKDYNIDSLISPPPVIQPTSKAKKKREGSRGTSARRQSPRDLEATKRKIQATFSEIEQEEHRRLTLEGYRLLHCYYFVPKYRLGRDEAGKPRIMKNIFIPSEIVERIQGYLGVNQLLKLEETGLI